MRPVPRVQCDDCHFEWYSASVADGLRFLGACPRCGGHLEFLAVDAPESAFSVRKQLERVAPAAVLGLPTSWAR